MTNMRLDVILEIHGTLVSLKGKKTDIRKLLESDTAKFETIFHGSVLDEFKEDENGKGVTLHFVYDYKSEDLSAL